MRALPAATQQRIVELRRKIVSCDDRDLASVLTAG
jgi:hypothetical protein